MMTDAWHHVLFVHIILKFLDVQCFTFTSFTIVREQMWTSDTPEPLWNYSKEHSYSMLGKRQNELLDLVRRSVPKPFSKESASNTTSHFLHVAPIQAKDLQHSTHLLSGNITDVGTSLVNGSESVIYIGGLFDLSDGEWSLSGRSELAAAELAIEHVNAKDIVPGHRLKLVYNDTQCDPGVGMDAFYDLIYRKPQMLMIIGSACSEVTKTLGELVPYWNLVLISYAATSPALSKREKYKTFFRLAPADSAQNPARRKFIQHFRWNTVATIHEDQEVFSLAIGDMIKDLEYNNITLLATESFKSSNLEMSSILKRLQEKDVRVFIGSFSEYAARQVFCEAFQLQLYGPRYVWMLTGNYVNNWWNVANDTNCTNEELAMATEGYFTVNSLNTIIDNETSIAGLSTEEFLDRYREFGGPFPTSAHVTNTYDTVWTVALTLRSAMSMRGNQFTSTDLDDFNYENGARMKSSFIKIIEQLSFLGVSGPVSFQGSDRESTAVIQRNQDGELQRVAVYEPETDELHFTCPSCHPILWYHYRIPRDKAVVVPRHKVINTLAFIVVASFCCAGIVLALCFLAFNLHYRSLKYIKLSSPKLNNVAVVGCVLVYAAVVVLGIDDSTVDEQTFVCTSRVFLLSAGFSLSFGSMFTKTYRVHQIFTRANSGLIKTKLLRDKQLLFIILALLFVDSVLVSLWVLLDPMDRQITNSTMETSEVDEDLVYLSQLSQCLSEHQDKWLGVIYAFKGLLLVFGVYMAWETRNVKVPALNDSQYIGMNVYNVVTTSIIVVVLSNMLAEKPTLAYTITSAFIVTSTTVTLCLLFVPKIYAIIRSKGNPVITSSGLTVEANTRRFAIDDRKELYYRAEVQNRVYKREIVELDQEIDRLERLLELPAHAYTRMTDELMFLLRESKVDKTPMHTRRRRLEEMQLCQSVSDTDDFVSYFGDSSTESIRPEFQREDSGVHGVFHRESTLSQRNKDSRLSIRERQGKDAIAEYQTVSAVEVHPEQAERVLVDFRYTNPLRRQIRMERNLSDKDLLLRASGDSDNCFGEKYSDMQIALKTFKDLKSKDEISDITKDTYVNKWTLPPGRKHNVTFGETSEHEHSQNPDGDKALGVAKQDKGVRIRKLQTDLIRIQKELQDLGTLEVSQV